MAKCVKCGAELAPGAVFCHLCGKKQVADTRKRARRGNGLGTVYRRGSTWVAEITKGYKMEDGVERRVAAKKGGFKTKKEALEYLPQLRGQKRREKQITWRKLYELWLPTHRASKSTIDCYRSAEKHFAAVDFLRLEDIEIDDLQECLDDCPKGKRTRQNMRTLCGLMYKYAIPRGYAGLNMASYLVVTGESGVSRASFTPEQLEAIRKAIGAVPYADYIYCMCYLGFRPSEFLALKIEDYDTRAKTLTGGAKTEAGKNRVVTISPKIQPMIDGIVAGRTRGALFCSRETGQAINYDYYRDAIFYPTLDRIGIANPVEDGRHKYSPHTCRHTFATLLKSVQAADKDKLELIGHTSPEMLRYYQDVSVEDLRKITDAI